MCDHYSESRGAVAYEDEGKIVTIHERPRHPDMEYLRDCLERPGGVDHVELKAALDYIDWLEKERVR